MKFARHFQKSICLFHFAPGSIRAQDESSEAMNVSGLRMCRHTLSLIMSIIYVIFDVFAADYRLSGNERVFTDPV